MIWIPLIAVVRDPTKVGPIWSWDDVVAHNPGWPVLVTILVVVLVGFTAALLGKGVKKGE